LPDKLVTVHRLSGKFFGGWTPDVPSIKDWKLAESPMRDAATPDQIPDRRTLGQNAPVMNQGDIGSCVGCSTAYGVEYLRRTDRDKLSTQYSPLFQYYMARVRDGEQWANVDAGAYIRDSMDSLRIDGIAPESKWKYVTKNFAKKPTASVLKAAGSWKLGAHWRCETVEDIMRALSSGCAVVGGIACYSSMFTRAVDQTGKIPMPSRTDTNEGGHALYFDRYTLSDRLFRFQNSWGTGWGDGGYGYVSFDYLANKELADDFWAMCVEAPETTPWKD
jgi:C1A family cysteine protease